MSEHMHGCSGLPTKGNKVLTVPCTQAFPHLPLSIWACSLKHLRIPTSMLHLEGHVCLSYLHAMSCYVLSSTLGGWGDDSGRLHKHADLSLGLEHPSKRPLQGFVSLAPALGGGDWKISGAHWLAPSQSQSCKFSERPCLKKIGGGP